MLKGTIMIYLHAGFMIAGLLLLVLGISSAVFMRRHKRWWLTMHKSCAYGTLLCTIVAIVVAFIMVATSGAPHLKVPHAYLGLFILLLIITTLTLGIAQFKIRKKTAMIRRLHRIAGVSTVILMFINIISGLFLTGFLALDLCILRP